MSFGIVSRLDENIKTAIADYSRSAARLGVEVIGDLAFSVLCRGEPSADLGFRLDFSILDTA
jgi:hypothetical protein